MRGAPLVTAESWQKERGSELSLPEWDFIDTSITFRASEGRAESGAGVDYGRISNGTCVALILLALP